MNGNSRWGRDAAGDVEAGAEQRRRERGLGADEVTVLDGVDRRARDRERHLRLRDRGIARSFVVISTDVGTSILLIHLAR